MANIQYLPYAQQVAAIDRQKRMAELLKQQGTEPLESQQVSGIVVPTSPWLGAIKMLQAGLGGYLEGKASGREAELKKKTQEEAQKSVQDLITAMGPQKAYTSTPVMEQSSDEDRTEMAPKTQFNDITGQYEPVQEWKETFKPGLSRNEALARILQMQTGENPVLAQLAPSLTALLPKEVSSADLFEKLDPSKMTTESIENVKKTGDVSQARFITEPTKTSWEYKTRTTYDKNGQPINQDFVFDPKSLEMRGVGTPYAGRPNYEPQQNVRQEAENYRQEQEFKMNYPGAATQGGRQLNAVDYRNFKEKDSAIDDASGNFTNFASVLSQISPGQGIAGKGAGQLSTAFKNAQASIRLLQTTGVLNQGEIPFLEQVLEDPQGFMSISNPTTRAKIAGQLEELDKLIARKKTNLYNQYEQPLVPQRKTTGSFNTQSNQGFNNIASGTESYY